LQWHQALANQIKKYYGNITAENTIQGIVPIVQTGDVHAVVYDLTDQVLALSASVSRFSVP
jgi:hypothetical protein